jgi:hypothetical protein
MAKKEVIEASEGNKVMLVTIDGLTGKPDFRFTGEWTGKDVTLMTGLLARAYHKHVKAVRASGIHKGGLK